MWNYNLSDNKIIRSQIWDMIIGLHPDWIDGSDCRIRLPDWIGSDYILDPDKGLDKILEMWTHIRDWIGPLDWTPGYDQKD